MDKFSPGTSYQKRSAILNGFWTCPAGKERYPKSSDITDDEEQKQNEKISPGAILAIVLACLVVVCAITGVLIWWLMNKDIIKLPQRIHDRFTAGLKQRDELKKQREEAKKKEQEKPEKQEKKEKQPAVVVPRKVEAKGVSKMREQRVL